MSIRVICALTIYLIFGITLGAANENANPAPSEAGSVEFTILNPDNYQVIGHAKYRRQDHDGRIFVIGENHYKDGEHDVERDELAIRPQKSVPVMVSFEHQFFNPDGSQRLAARADTTAGNASCISYIDGEKHDVSKKIDFPPDTYAGAAAVTLMESEFRKGDDHIDFHVFDCTPEPALTAVTAEHGDENEHWPPYPHPLVRARVTADLGGAETLLGGILPHRNAWFDASHEWHYVGGQIQRYLARGPQVILVRKATGPKNLASEAR